MMAVECRIPLRGFEDPVGLIEEVVSRIDPTWKLYYGGEKELDVVQGVDIIEAAERAFGGGDRRRIRRNESDDSGVLGKDTGRRKELSVARSTSHATGVDSEREMSSHGTSSDPQSRPR